MHVAVKLDRGLSVRSRGSLLSLQTGVLEEEALCSFLPALGTNGERLQVLHSTGTLLSLASD